MLFMSLFSGRNPHYLIGEQVIAAPIVKDYDIEAIPTAYLILYAILKIYESNCKLEKPEGKKHTQTARWRQPQQQQRQQQQQQHQQHRKRQKLQKQRKQ